MNNVLSERRWIITCINVDGHYSFLVNGQDVKEALSEAHKLTHNKIISVVENYITKELVEMSDEELKKFLEYLHLSQTFGTVDNEYTMGLVNGLELAIAYIEKRDPIFIKGCRK